MTLDLVDEKDVIAPRGRNKTKEKDREKDNVGRVVIKKKPERPVRILRIRYYQKISLLFMQGDTEYRDAFAVDRSLEDLLRELGYNTTTKGVATSHDYVLVEKGSKMGANNKFLFVEIGTNDFYTLKKQMENHTTICGYNKGEFIILDGKRSSLAETFDIPKIWKEPLGNDAQVPDKNVLTGMERLRDELKGDLKPYHSYEDEQIDRMKDPELIRLKQLANRKIKIEDRDKDFYREFLK